MVPVRIVKCPVHSPEFLKFKIEFQNTKTKLKTRHTFFQVLFNKKKILKMSSSSSSSSSSHETMFMAVLTHACTDFNPREIDSAVEVHTTELHRTRSECLQAMWRKCIDLDYIASSPEAFVMQLDERDRYDLEWLLNPENEEELAVVCRRLFPSAYHSHPQDMPPADWRAHLRSLVVTRTEFDLVMFELSSPAANHRVMAFTYQLKQVVIPPTISELAVTAESLSQQETIRHYQERVAEMRVSNARYRLQSEVLRQQVESLSRQVQHLQSRDERRQEQRCTSRRRLNFEEL